MIKIVIFQGGLGNQMFLYAFTLALKQRFKFSFIEIQPLDCYHVHNGFELPYVFKNFRQSKSLKYYQTIKKIYSKYLTRILFNKVIETGPGHYCSNYEKRFLCFAVYIGYWQTEEYFKNIDMLIRKTFQFKTERLNIKSVEILKTIKLENSVSIHVRRGDYVENAELRNICSFEYYKNAINYINTKFDDLTYYIFSDDKNWVKENFTSYCYNLIDWNNKNDNWQDMFLMSQCKHNIIANSSFSWWAAWLNKNQNKIVISPQKWTKSLNTKDIIPQNWIKLQIENQL